MKKLVILTAAVFVIGCAQAPPVKDKAGNQPQEQQKEQVAVQSPDVPPDKYREPTQEERDNWKPDWNELWRIISETTF